MFTSDNQYNERMTWKTSIADLQSSGCTQVQIAQEIGCSQATVSELLAGKIKNPSFPVGQALLAMHKREMRKFSKAQGKTKVSEVV